MPLKVEMSVDVLVVPHYLLVLHGIKDMTLVK